LERLPGIATKAPLDNQIMPVEELRPVRRRDDLQRRAAQTPEPRISRLRISRPSVGEPLPADIADPETAGEPLSGRHQRAVRLQHDNAQQVGGVLLRALYIRRVKPAGLVQRLVAVNEIDLDRHLAL